MLGQYTSQDVDTLLSRRQFASFTLIVETDPTSAPLSPMLLDALDRVDPLLKRTQPGHWAGSGALLQWSSPVLRLHIRLNGQQTKDSELTLRFAQKRLRNMIGTLNAFNLPVRFASLVLDIDHSSKGLPFVGHLLASYVTCPELGDIYDAQWRASIKVEDRYFLNWTASLYETRNLTLQTSLGEQGQLVAAGEVSEPVDAGLKLQIDANTKVNVLEKLGPIQLNETDAERLCGLIKVGIEKGTALLRRAGR